MIDFDRLMNDPTSRPDDLRAAAAALVERAAELEGGSAPSTDAVLLLNVDEALLHNVKVTIYLDRETGAPRVLASCPDHGVRATHAPLAAVVDVDALWEYWA